MLIRTLITSLFIFLFCQVSLAQKDSVAQQKLTFTADTRLRLEYDWNRITPDGQTKSDRTRMRFRFRFGFDYQWSDNIKFGGRMRSGYPEDQQSPHWTLGKEFEVYSFKIDKVYIAGQHKSFWWWAGKNSFPFWKRNELFWDNDVNPEGLSCGLNIKPNEQLTVKPSAGLFISNSAGSFFDDDGTVYIGQIALEKKYDRSTFNLASGIYSFQNINDLNQKPLDKKINYDLWISSVQWQLNRQLPIKLGFDFIRNLTDYKDYEWIRDAALEDEKTAFVASLSFGKLKSEGDIQFGYSYAHIPKYSVVDYFAQDDWTSWSFPADTPGTRSSNFKGHELQAAYAFGESFNVVARMYFVEGIKKNDPTVINKERANRFRVDLNIGF